VNGTYPSYVYTATSQYTVPVVGVVPFTLPSGFTYNLTETYMADTSGNYVMSDEQYTVTVSKGVATVTDGSGKVVNLDGSGQNQLFQFVNPPPGKTLTGYVEPLVTENPVPGDDAWEHFLDKFIVNVELRSSFSTPATDPGLKTTAKWDENTDDIGTFIFTGVQPGNYVLYIDRPGYLPRCMNVTVSKADPTTIKLQPPTSTDPRLPADQSMPDGQRIFSLWWGDCNGDGLVDGQDIMMIQQYMNLDGASPYYVPSCDLNVDGLIDGQDVLMDLANQNLSLDMYPGAGSVIY